MQKPSIILDAAQKVVSAAIDKAVELGVAATVHVVDESGVVTALARMDDALLVSVDAARLKATTALANKAPTAAIAGSLAGDPVMAAAFAALPGMVAIPGGVPILHEGRAVGAVGVSGGLPDQDDVIAQAGAGALTPQPA